MNLGAKDRPERWRLQKDTGLEAESGRFEGWRLQKDTGLEPARDQGGRPEGLGWKDWAGRKENDTERS